MTLKHQNFTAESLEVKSRLFKVSASPNPNGPLPSAHVQAAQTPTRDEAPEGIVPQNMA